MFVIMSAHTTTERRRPPAFVSSTAGTKIFQSRPNCTKPPRPNLVNRKASHSRRSCVRAQATSNDNPNPSSDDQERVERLRMRLEGLFGTDADNVSLSTDGDFDGEALRAAIRDRWGVEYDVQPQKRHGRVYVQIMWRYFEQQSFYMAEDEFASHCEAVAQLLRQWNAVDYFCDYIASIKKRPVVGITINIPIPGVDASQVVLE